jgi:endoglycosylceramidase
VLALAGCGDNLPQPADGFVHDAEGRALILRGVNLAGAHKNAPYTDVFGPADYTRLHDDWGLTAVRFLITWSAVEPMPGQFDDAYLDWVAERAGWANDAGLYVVLDMHQDVFGEGFGFDGAPAWACDATHYAGFTPMQPWGINYADSHVMACFDQLWSDPSELVAAWRHVAEHLAGAPAIIGFDPINEPSWGSYGIATFERDRLQPFYESAIAEVRKAAPKWLAFAEPSNSRALGFSTSLQPFHASGVVYSPHLYDVDAERTGMFDPAHAPDLVEMGSEFADEAKRMGTALWIGEYGGQGVDPNVGAYMGADYDAAAAVSAGSMIWAYDEGGGYSLLDAQGNEVPSLVAALVRPFPTRVAGTPGAWSYDPTTRTFELDWTSDPAIDAETRIAIPSRVYPNGVSVDCGGCATDIVAGELYVHHPATHVIVRPGQ